MTEQRPRMQTRAAVVPLSRGDAVAFAVNSRPVREGAVTTRSSSATASASCALAAAMRSVHRGLTRPALKVWLGHAPTKSAERAVC